MDSVHLSIELFCSFLAFIIIVPLFLTFALYRERARLYLGVGFFSAGLSNLLHVLMVHKIGIAPYSMPEFFVPLSGILPRFILPLFFISAIICDKYFKKSENPAKEIFTLTPLILLSVISIALIILNIETSLKLILNGTLVKRPQDLISGFIGFGIIPFLIGRKENLWRFLTSGLFLMSISSVTLSFSYGFDSPLYVSAHIFKLFAFLSFASGIIYDTWWIRNIELERGELYEKLRMQEEFNEEVLNSIADGVYVTDNEKRVIFWSRGAELITGYSSTEAVGRKCSEFLKHLDEKDNVLCNTPACPLNKVIEKNSATGVETYNLKTKFGIDRKIDITAAPIFNNKGNLLHIVGVFRDVTMEKEAQKHLRIAYEKLLELDRLKNGLYQLIVHDMKNPLTAIISTAELMEYDKNIPADEMRENIQIITSEGMRLLNMINSILDLEKLESGKLKLDITTVNINDIIRREINLLKIPAQLKNINIQFNEEKVSLCTCDPIFLSRVIMNLLDNAIKYARTLVKVKCEENNEKLTICVEDDGPGIPEEYHSKIFEKFETVELRKYGRKYSTGLGLTFCKMAVEKMGGKIWLESEMGTGSKFYFTLPLAKDSTTETKVSIDSIQLTCF
jgi:PAS domain S-box-containing protein